VSLLDSLGGTVKVGNGNGDTVVDNLGSNNTITVGNGKGDVVNDSSGHNNAITVGNGSDNILVGNTDTIRVGIGHDSFVFQQTTPGTIGAVTVTGFD
jgi:hypothetical protein